MAAEQLSAEGGGCARIFSAQLFPGRRPHSGTDRPGSPWLSLKQDLKFLFSLVSLVSAYKLFIYFCHLLTGCSSA